MSPLWPGLLIITGILILCRALWFEDPIYVINFLRVAGIALALVGAGWMMTLIVILASS